MINSLQSIQSAGAPTAQQQAGDLARVEREIQARIPEQLERRNVESSGPMRQGRPVEAPPVRSSNHENRAEEAPSPQMLARIAEELQAAQAEEKTRLEPTMLERIVEEFNHDLSSYTSLRFSLDKELDSPVVRVVDTASEQLIRQIPPDEIIRLVKRMREFAGIIFDKKV